MSRFTYTTAGESHGPGLTAVITGLPAGLPFDASLLAADMAQRKLGYGRGGRMAIEEDLVSVTAGVRHGETTGAPVALWIENRDWENWRDVMSVGESKEPVPPVTLPRPGHADLAGIQKYGLKDIRDVLERASARETAARVAVGSFARQFLLWFGIETAAHVFAIGDIGADPDRVSFQEAVALPADSDMPCVNQEAAQRMRRAIDAAAAAGDTLGGRFEVMADNLPPGLGTYADWRGRLDNRLGGAVLSVPAVKGVEFGSAARQAFLPGSKAHDPIIALHGDAGDRGSNLSGGLEGGMTNGSTLRIRGTMKPIPTIKKGLPSVDIASGEPGQAHFERSDTCAVPACAFVCRSMTAIVLAEAMLEKFGGDHIADTKAAYDSYLERISR